MPQIEILYQNVLKLRCWPLALILYTAFFLKKIRFRTKVLGAFFALSLKKIFLTIYFIYWPNFIAWLSLFKIYFLMVIVCCPVYNITNFKINYSDLIKLFLYITENSRQKIKYRKNKKGFKHEIKSIFHHF